MNDEIYNMVDGAPIWQHLKKGSEKRIVKMVANDYGKLAEIIGKRVLFTLTDIGNLDKFFPDVKILSAQKLNEGDFALEVASRRGVKYCKKIIIFEIKHGKTQIRQRQLRRYCSMILYPDKFFKKASEVKIFFMIFDHIDTIRNFSSYTMRELDKSLAEKILSCQSVSKDENTTIYDRWKNEKDKKDTANLILSLYGEVEI